MNNKIKKIYKLPVKFNMEGIVEVKATNIEEAIYTLENDKAKGLLRQFEGNDIRFNVGSDVCFELLGDKKDFIEAEKEKIGTDYDRALIYDYSNFYDDEKEDDNEVIVEIFELMVSVSVDNSARFTVNYIGTTDMDKYNKDNSLKIYNWENWTDKKPENLHAWPSPSGCAYGVVFHPRNTDIYDISIGVEWQRVNTLQQVHRHFIDKGYNKYCNEFGFRLEGE